MNYCCYHVIIVIIAVVLGSDMLDGSSNDSNDETTFVVGFDAEFPPYGYKDDSGNYAGFDLELVQEVAKRNNWTFVAQLLTVFFNVLG